MDETFIIEFIEKYGYFSMFIFNWLLIFGLPLPNEVAAAVSGMMTEVGNFKPIPAFLTAYTGLISSMTFAYFIGVWLGERLLTKMRKTFFNKTIIQFQQFLHSKGRWAISASFFLPGVRWAMPYVVGSNRLPLKTFMLFAYPAGFVWMLIYFSIGRASPHAYNYIIERIQPFLIAAAVAAVLLLIVKLIRKNKFEKMADETYTNHRYGKKG